MARPSHISDAQILDAAQGVFLEKGFHEATTALIAERAGISEGSIFNHFKDKATLFACSMEFGSMAMLESLFSRAGEGEPRATLLEITLSFLDRMIEMVPKIMMVWSHRAAMESPTADNHGPPPEVVQRVSNYFQTEMELGRMRAGDPEVVARIWLGTLWGYAVSNLEAGARSSRKAKHAYVQAVIDQLWSGLAPAAPAPPSTRPLTRRKK